MKNLTYIYALPAFLILFSCGAGRGNEPMVNEDKEDAVILHEDEVNEISQSEMEEMEETHKETITADEIPSEIAASIEKDEYLSTLDLNSVVKIHNNDQIYYELTFKDDSNKIFAVIFDDRGNKMTI